MAKRVTDYRDYAPDSAHQPGSKARKTLDHCKRRVDDAVKWRKNAKFDETWAKLIKMYGNKYEYPELDAYEDVIAPNMVFSTVNVIVPSITVNYPKITVTPLKPEDAVRAQTVEAVTNYYWRHYDVHEEFRAVVKDFSVIGHGWAKVTWTFRESQRPIRPDEWQQALEAALTQRNLAQESAKMNGMSDMEFPTDEEVIDSIPSVVDEVVEDNPSVERLSPFDVYVDPDATRLKNARWIAQRMYIPLERAKSREDWDESARKSLHGTAMSEAKKDQDTLFDGEERGKESEFVVVWEYYDLVAGTVSTFADGADEFLLAPSKVPYGFAHPFVMVANYQVPEKFYPIGDVETVMPLQMELALTRTQMVNDRKRYRRMYFYRPDKIGSEGVNQLLSGDDNSMIAVDGDEPFTELMAPLETSSLPAEFYNQSSMILDDINLVSGVSEYQRGSVAEIRRTATEAAMIQDGSNARSADKLSIIERAIGEVAERVIALAQQYLTADKVAQISGEDDAVSWVVYNRDEIAGEFDFIVEAGSTQPQNESFRRQSAMQLMDAMAPFMGSGVINESKVLEHVLRMGFGIKNPSEFLTGASIPPPVPPAGGGEIPNGQPPMI